MRYETLFFGTGNAHKLEEIAAVLQGIHLRSFRDLPAPLEVAETESTLEGNARLKARAYHAHTGLPAFADDTGLEVTALQGRPGVYSARYAGPEGNAAANVQKLLQELEGMADRSAQFRTVIAFDDGSGEVRLFEGIVRGSIAQAPRGEQGFGYDPVFIPEGETRTFAEMRADEKNAISHRARAVRTFIQYVS